MVKTNTVVLSDLHLGDTECLLFKDANAEKYDIIELTIEKIEKISKNSEGNACLNRLVLAGDIPELSQADEVDTAYDHTRDFLTRLLKKVDCEEIVYIPGNHDHHFWVDLIESISGKGYKDSKKTCGIDEVIDGDQISFAKRFIPEDFSEKLSISYPNYTFKVYNSYFFVTHGYHFSKELPDFFRSLINEKDLELEKLEEVTYKFIEAIWWKRRKLEHFLPLEFIYDYGWRGIPKTLKYLKKVVKKSFKTSNRNYGTSFEEDSTPLGSEQCVNMIKWYLEDVCKIGTLPKEKDFHLIYGHTHQGGRLRKTDSKIRINGYFINLWNTGGWIVPSKLYSPDAYIFYVKEDEAQRKAIPDMVKMVAKPKAGEDGYGDYNRELLSERLKRIGE